MDVKRLPLSTRPTLCIFVLPQSYSFRRVDRKLGDGLFLNTCRAVGKRYESFGIKTEDMIVDNASMQVRLFSSVALTTTT